MSDDFDALRQKLRGANGDIAETLTAVVDFLRDAGIETELTAPMSNLYFALLDAKEGRSNPLIEREAMETGTSKKLVFETLQWSMAAAAVTVLKDEAKWGLTTAVAHVARRMGFETEQLKEFRKNLMKGKGPAGARQNYDNFVVHDRRTYHDLTPEVFVDVMLMKGRALKIG
jgi:hypothetical protein